VPGCLLGVLFKVLGQWEVSVSPGVLPSRGISVPGCLLGVLFKVLRQWEVSVSPGVLPSRDISWVDCRLGDSFWDLEAMGGQCLSGRPALPRHKHVPVQKKWPQHLHVAAYYHLWG